MEKEFVPYEQALALKELGFDEKCGACYYKKFYYEIGYHKVYRDFNFVQLTVSAPTFSQAIRFFREKYMLSGEIYIFKNIWNFDIEDIKTSMQLYTSDIMCYNSYEEAELACLVKLIEICRKLK